MIKSLQSSFKSKMAENLTQQEIQARNHSVEATLAKEQGVTIQELITASPGSSSMFTKEEREKEQYLVASLQQFVNTINTPADVPFFPYPVPPTGETTVKEIWGDVNDGGVKGPLVSGVTFILKDGRERKLFKNWM